MPKEAHKIPVKDYQFTEKMSVDELVMQMDDAWGFTAGKACCRRKHHGIT